MKKTLLGLDFELKKKSASLEASMADIKAINDDQVQNIKSIDLVEIRKRVADVSVDGLGTESQLTQARGFLREYGIVVVPNYIDSGVSKKFRQSLNNLCKEYLEQLKYTIYEDSRLLVQSGGAKLCGYSKLANYSKPVLQVREGQDAGMIDIFNVDKLNPEGAQALREGFEKDGLRQLLSNNYYGLIAQNLNCYINEKITRTRGFHVDSYETQLKGFVYLTDVAGLDDGPYTYVKCSHEDSPYRRINRSISASLPNKTEAPLVNPKNIVPVIAPSGSLVISDQSGFHRGFPQGKENRRMIAVMNYREEKK